MRRDMGKEMIGSGLVKPTGGWGENEDKKKRNGNRKGEKN